MLNLHLRRRAWFTCVIVLALCTLGTTRANAIATTLVGQDFMETLVPICGGKSDCLIHFSTVPDGMELLVTRVTCEVLVNNQGATLYITRLGYKNNSHISAPYSQLIPVIVATLGETFRYFKINNEVLHPFDEKQTPTIEIGGPFNFKTGELNCSIAGVLRPTPSR